MARIARPRPTKNLPHDMRHLPGVLQRLERPLAADLRWQYREYLRRLVQGLELNGPSAVSRVTVPAPGPQFTAHLKAAVMQGGEQRGKIMRARVEHGAWHFWRQVAQLDDTPARIVLDVADRRGLFSPSARFVQRYVDSRVPPLAHVSEQLQRKAGSIVADSLAQGGSGAVVGALRSQFPEFAESRVRAIARTETMTAFNDASLALAYENPMVTGYEWCAAMCENTCEECADLDGQQFRYEDGGPYPPLHVNCQCVPVGIYVGQDADAQWTDGPPVYDRTDAEGNYIGPAGLEGQPIHIHPGFGEMHVAGLERPDVFGFAQEVSAALQAAGYATDAAQALYALGKEKQ
jgi:SPP1 gp7 family putative phage head morphogenesis protein